MRKTLSAVALAGLMFAGAAVPADAATTSPNSSFARCTAYNRFCQFQAPGWNTRLQAYLGWLRAVRCERFPSTCPTVWKP